MSESEYTIRVDAIYKDTLDHIKHWFGHWDMVLYEEISTKTKKLHYQGICRNENMTEKQFRHRTDAFRKKYLYKGACASFSTVLKPDYKRYIKKDGKLVYMKGYTQEDIDSWGEWENKDYHFEKSKKLKSALDFRDKFIDYIGEQQDLEMGIYSHRWISRHLFDFLSNSSMVKNFSYYKSLIYSVQSFYTRTHQKKDKEILYEKFYSQLML